MVGVLQGITFALIREKEIQLYEAEIGEDQDDHRDEDEDTTYGSSKQQKSKEVLKVPEMRYSDDDSEEELMIG